MYTTPFGKSISELLQSLTQNKCTLKDIFDGASRIKAMLSPALFAKGHGFVSFGVESLLNNVAL